MEPLLLTYLASVAVSAFATLSNAEKNGRSMRRKGLVTNITKEDLHKFQNNNKKELSTRIFLAYGSFFIPVLNILLATAFIIVNSSKKAEELMHEKSCTNVKDINLDHIENSPYTDKKQLEEYIKTVAEENTTLQEKRSKIKNFHINGTLPLNAYRLIKSAKKANETVDSMNITDENQQEKLTEKFATKYRKEIKEEQKQLKSYGKQLEKTMFKTRS